MLSPTTPLFNTVIIYIIIIIILLLLKPEFMFCKETKKFKEFGISENKTLVSFPMICISSGILLYMIFMIINVVSDILNKSE